MKDSLTFQTRPHKQMKRSAFKQKATVPMKRTTFKSKIGFGKPKTSRRRKKSTRVKLVPLGTLRRTCDALMQQIGKLKNPVSLISGLPTQVHHHLVPKSCSSALRYNWDNLIPLTNGEHCRLHQSPDPTTEMEIVRKRGGTDWFFNLKQKGREYNKVNRQYYENIKITLEKELVELSTDI